MFVLKSTRIESVDGLKGLCGIWVVVFHYLLAYAAFGYIGWESGVAVADRAECYFRYFPYSILSNGSWPLYIFFAIIAFIPAFIFFQKETFDNLRRQVTIRYFRLFFPVAGCILLALLVWKSGGFFNQLLGDLLKNNWDKAFYTTVPSLKDALYCAVYKTPFTGNCDYCSVLWCMSLILYGSYFSYLSIMGVAMLKRRCLIYCGLFLLTFADPSYTAFLGGIIAADIVVRLNKKNMVLPGWLNALLFAGGCVIGNFPEVWLGKISVFTVYGIGAFLVLIPCCNSIWVQKILSNRFLVKAGQYSFALVLAHFSVMMSFSAWLFLKLHDSGISYAWNLVIVFLTAIPANWLVGVIFYHLIEKPSAGLTDWIYRKLA